MTTRAKKSGARVDWADIRARLAASMEHASGVPSTPEQTLKARAERLAVPLERESAREKVSSVLYFERAARRYAIAASYVLGVQACGRLNRVPRAQPSLIGVTNLRGDVLPVFDLSVLEGKGSPSSASPEFVVLGRDQPELAFLVDGGCDVSEVPESHWTEPRALGPLPHARFVRGVGADARLLLDGDAVLRDRKVFVARPGSSEPGRIES